MELLLYPPQIDERRFFCFVINQQANAVSLFHDSSNNRVNEEARVQRHGYAVTDFELPWG